MRIITTDKSDKTTIVFEVISAGYDPEEKEFWADTENDDSIYIDEITQEMADAYMGKLAEFGFVDLRMHEADVQFSSCDCDCNDGFDEVSDNDVF